MDKPNFNVDNILFAAVDKFSVSPYYEYGIYYFPNETELRTWKLGRKNVIWLDQVANKTCKKCLGAGKLGENLKEAETSLSEVTTLIRKHIDDNPEKLPLELIQLFKISSKMEKPLHYLVKAAVKEISDVNQWDVSEKYAKMLMKDLRVKEIVWCKCFIKNLNKQIAEIQRLNKFFMN